MAVCLYMYPTLAAWYTSYVVLFNVLVGPVFSAGSITSERERQTLELLLTTTLSPWQILSAKLYSGLRISCVLTSFLIWPLLLVWLLPPWTYLATTRRRSSATSASSSLTSLTTTTLAMFCSVIFRKTSVSMMTTYLVLMLLFAMPVATKLFTNVFFRSTEPVATSSAPLTDPQTWVNYSTCTSPLAAAFSLPLRLQSPEAAAAGSGRWWAYTCPAYIGLYTAVDIVLLSLMLWLFNVRWRVRV